MILTVRLRLLLLFFSKTQNRGWRLAWWFLDLPPTPQPSVPVAVMACDSPLVRLQCHGAILGGLDGFDSDALCDPIILLYDPGTLSSYYPL